MDENEPSVFKQMMEGDRRMLFERITQKYEFEDLPVLCSYVGVDFDGLSGENRAAKVIELIAYMDLQGQLPQLAEAIEKVAPGSHTQMSPLSDASILTMDLASLRQQLVSLQKDAVTEKELQRGLEEMVKTVNRAVGRSQELTARVLLPRAEDMDIHLIPSHSFERLEEYRSDENVACLLIGVFAGAILGVLGNWATDERLMVTRFSMILLVLLASCTVVSCVWARRLHQRAASIMEKMLCKGTSPLESS